jgi:HNH endonuclease
MRRKFEQTQIRTSAANELLTCFERFVYDRPIDSNEGLHFSDMPLTDYALQTAIIEPRTALHKALDYLADIYFHLYAYDDVDFAPDLVGEFADYVRWMFSEMGMTAPTEFSSLDPDVLRRARDEHRNAFSYGLHNIVVSAYAIAWQRKTLMFDFNMKLAERIRPLKKTNSPVLEADGRLPRGYFPSWLVNSIQHRDRGLCQQCGRPALAVFGSVESPHIDHMVALAIGGGNDPTNLQLLCGNCNLAKGAKMIEIRDEFSWPNARGN